MKSLHPDYLWIRLSRHPVGNRETARGSRVLRLVSDQWTACDDKKSPGLDVLIPSADISVDVPPGFPVAADTHVRTKTRPVLGLSDVDIHTRSRVDGTLGSIRCPTEDTGSSLRGGVPCRRRRPFRQSCPMAGDGS